MPYRAFISSTYVDLRKHREYVIEKLRHSGFFIDPMEDWTATSDEPKTFSQARLDGCDICVLLVGFRRGFIPEDEEYSITQLEYTAARKRGIDIFVFMLDEDAPWPRKYDELGKDPEIVKWRHELLGQHGVSFFGLDPTSIDLAPALSRWLAEKAIQSDISKTILTRSRLPGEKTTKPDEETLQGSLTKENPSLAITLPLFEQHKAEGFYSEVERGLLDDFRWTTKKAHAAGFVLRELVSNAFVHGCQGQGELEVSIQVRLESEGRKLIIRVEDQGSGFDLQKILEAAPASIDDKNWEPKGLWIVDKNTYQLIASSDGRVIQAAISKFSHYFLRKPLQVISLEKDNIYVVSLVDRLDSSTTPHVEDYITKLQVQRTKNAALVIDLEAVEFISSRGCWFLLELLKMIRRGMSQFKTIYLTSASEGMLLSFELSGMTSFFGEFIRDNLDDVLEEFS